VNSFLSQFNASVINRHIENPALLNTVNVLSILAYFMQHLLFPLLFE